MDVATISVGSISGRGALSGFVPLDDFGEDTGGFLSTDKGGWPQYSEECIKFTFGNILIGYHVHVFHGGEFKIVGALGIEEYNTAEMRIEEIATNIDSEVVEVSPTHMRLYGLFSISDEPNAEQVIRSLQDVSAVTGLEMQTSNTVQFDLDIGAFSCSVCLGLDAELYNVYNVPVTSLDACQDRKREVKDVIDRRIESNLSM